MADEQQGGFPQNEARGQDPNSTTGDGHPPRPGEQGTQEEVAGQGLGQGDKDDTAGGGAARN